MFESERCATTARLHVLGWQQLYETTETKRIQRLSWVPVPNRMDSAGYSALMSHPNGLAHFGAWIAILEVCSRGKGPENRGWFDAPAYYAGLPAALAGVSRGSAEVFEEALQRLEHLQWIKIEKIPQIQQHQVMPTESAGASTESTFRTEQNRTEQKGMEQNRTAAPPFSYHGQLDEQYSEFKRLYEIREDVLAEDFNGFAWQKWRLLDGLQKQARIDGLRARIDRGDDPAFFEKPEKMIEAGYKRGPRPEKMSWEEKQRRQI